MKSRQIGVATGSVLILGYTGLVFPRLMLQSPEEALQVGGLWMVCMLIFEFAVGHFWFRFSWRWLLNDFNLLKGRLLGLGMIFLALAPWIAGRLHGAW